MDVRSTIWKEPLLALPGTPDGITSPMVMVAKLEVKGGQVVGLIFDEHQYCVSCATRPDHPPLWSLSARVPEVAGDWFPGEPVEAFVTRANAAPDAPKKPAPAPEPKEG